MFWSTFATDAPPARTDDVQALLIEKHGAWKSPYIRQIIDAASDPRFTKLLVLPRYEVPYLPHWTSLHGTALAPKTGSARIMLVGDAAHAAAPDSGQGASMALEDVQMLAMLLRHYSSDLPKVAKAYEDMRIPRVGRILRLGRRNGDGKREISWFRAAVRDLMLWIMCTFFFLPVFVSVI